MIYVFQTPDSPSAQGREMRPGDTRFRLWFPTDDGGKVEVVMGRSGLEQVAEVIDKMVQYESEETQDEPDVLNGPGEDSRPT